MLRSRFERFFDGLQARLEHLADLSICLRLCGALPGQSGGPYLVCLSLGAAHNARCVRHRGFETEPLLEQPDGVLEVQHVLVGLALGRCAVQHVRQRVGLANAVEVIFLEPKISPLSDDGLHFSVVEVHVEERDVRQALQRTLLETQVDLFLEAVQYRDGAAGFLEDVELGVAGVENGIDEVDGQTPALPVLSTVQVVLDSNGEIQLGLQRVKDEIHLVEQHHTLPE